MYLAAPSQSPGAIEWNLTNSKIFLKWEQVKASQNESEVMGYKVSFSDKQQKCGNKHCLSSCHLNKWLSHCVGKMDLSALVLQYGLALSGPSKLKDLFQMIKWRASGSGENPASSNQYNDDSYLIYFAYFVWTKTVFDYSFHYIYISSPEICSPGHLKISFSWSCGIREHMHCRYASFIKTPNAKPCLGGFLICFHIFKTMPPISLFHLHASYKGQHRTSL